MGAGGSKNAAGASGSKNADQQQEGKITVVVPGNPTMTPGATAAVNMPEKEDNNDAMGKLVGGGRRKSHRSGHKKHRKNHHKGRKTHRRSKSRRQQ